MLHFWASLLIMVLRVARLWVDCFDYQSNTVILGELVFRGWPQPALIAKKRATLTDGSFLFKRPLLF
jgi:hypothetical protein